MSDIEERLAHAFPPLGLRVTAGPLERRSNGAEETRTLVDDARVGGHNHGTMPFSYPWTDASDADLPSHYLQGWGRTLATFSVRHHHCR